MTEQLKSLNKQQLIERCAWEINRNKALSQHLDETITNMRTAQQLNANTQSMYNALRRETAEEIESLRRSAQHARNDTRIAQDLSTRAFAVLEELKETTDTELQLLKEEVSLLRTSEHGQRQAANRLAREAMNLTRELHEFKDEMKQHKTELALIDVSFMITSIIENSKAMLDEMEECLIDPISYNIFDDPVTLGSGHTINRDSMHAMMRNLRAGEMFRCPVTNARIPTPGPQQQRSHTISMITTIYNTMRRRLTESESEINDLLRSR